MNFVSGIIKYVPFIGNYYHWSDLYYQVYFRLKLSVSIKWIVMKLVNNLDIYIVGPIMRMLFSIVMEKFYHAFVER